MGESAAQLNSSLGAFRHRKRQSQHGAGLSCGKHWNHFYAAAEATALKVEERPCYWIVCS